MIGENLGIDFTNPLTKALFDRTPQQRRRHGELMLVLSGAGKKIDPSELADRIMCEEYFETLATDIKTRTTDLVSDAIMRGVAVDLKTLEQTAAQKVRADIAELDAVLPIVVPAYHSNLESFSTVAMKPAPTLQARPRRQIS